MSTVCAVRTGSLSHTRDWRPLPRRKRQRPLPPDGELQALASGAYAGSPRASSNLAMWFSLSRTRAHSRSPPCPGGSDTPRRRREYKSVVATGERIDLLVTDLVLPGSTAACWPRSPGSPGPTSRPVHHLLRPERRRPRRLPQGRGYDDQAVRCRRPRHAHSRHRRIERLVTGWRIAADADSGLPPQTGSAAHCVRAARAEMACATACRPKPLENSPPLELLDERRFPECREAASPWSSIVNRP